LIGWATVLAQTIWENDWARSRVSLAGYLVWGVLTLVALARYGEAIAWAAAESWVFVLFVLSIVVVGVYGMIRSRSLAHHLSPAAEPLRPAD
jgi:cobalamin biosynthesis protein CobD/CbiB